MLPQLQSVSSHAQRDVVLIATEDKPAIDEKLAPCPTNKPPQKI
jgi:hypothetical protein